jgi:hypothetical protein
MPFGPKGLVVTLSLPVPKDARVTYANSAVFTAVDAVMGPDIPASFPKKYSTSLHRVEAFNQNMSFETAALTGWNKRHNVDMKPDFIATFDRAFSSGKVVASMLVEHPAVSHPEQFADACSVVLQRAVIFSDPGPDGRTETFYLRSYLHSVDDSSKEAVNFVASTGFRVSFPSQTVWFPLELTTGIAEPTAWVVLDILSNAPLNQKELPSAFRVVKTAKMTYQGKAYHVVRVTAQLDTKQKWQDLNVGLATR